MEDEVLVHYDSPEGPRAKFVRSTLIGSSLETLRGIGLYERLVSELPRDLHEPLLYTFAPTWLPIDIVNAYYDAWEQLPMSEELVAQVAAQINEWIMGSLLGTLIRGARAAGLTPWVPLSQYDRLWSRVFRGGGVRVVRKGPKEASIETVGLPMLDLPRFRDSYVQLIRAAGSLFAKTFHSRPVPGKQSGTHRVLVSWA